LGGVDREGVVGGKQRPRLRERVAGGKTGSGWEWEWTNGVGADERSEPVGARME
jgi:hypothetical protein